MATNRTRMFFDADEELKLAIQMEALKQDSSASNLISNILRQQLKDAVSEARKVIQQRKKGGKQE